MSASDIVGNEVETKNVNTNSTHQVDFYQVLGLSQDATTAQIYEKYLKLSLLHHPDKGGDAEKYKQVNLAYKVLKNPENRKKYNDSLSKTFDQLKEETRDTQYHTNPEFLKGDSTFDEEKFQEEFEKKRSQFNEISSINPRTEIKPKSLEEIIAEREQELAQFKGNQQTVGMFDPQKQNDEFNFVFEQYKSMKTMELQETTEHGFGETKGGFSVIKFGDYLPQDASQISKIAEDVQQHYLAMGKELPVSKKDLTSLDPNEHVELFAKHSEERQKLLDVDNMKDKYIVEIDDSDKVVLEALDSDNTVPNKNTRTKTKSNTNTKTTSVRSNANSDDMEALMKQRLAERDAVLTQPKR